MVGLRLRYSSKDACHAPMDELDEDARAWVQRRIDTSRSGGSSSPAETSGKPLSRDSFSDVSSQPSDVSAEGEMDDGLSADEWIRLGRSALEEYDYDSCEDRFLKALHVSKGGTDAALALLELYMDHLAAYEKAADLRESVSLKSYAFCGKPEDPKKAELANVLMAIADAYCGRIESALESVRRSSHPDASKVYLAAVRHFIEKGDEPQARTLLSRLATFDDPALSPEIDVLAKDVESLKTNRLKPKTRKMISEWKLGNEVAALALADEILSEMPENKDACRIRGEYEKRLRDEKIARLLGLANEAEKARDFARQAELLKQAMGAGAKGGDLARRLERAEENAVRQKKKEEVRNVLHLLSQGELKQAFADYARLGERRRDRIRKDSGDRRFVWIDAILSSPAALKPEKMADAILALDRAMDDLRSGANPEAVIAGVTSHMKALRSVPEALDLLKRADELLETANRQRELELLDRIEDCISGERLEEARELAGRIKPQKLEETARHRFGNLMRKLRRSQKFASLEQQYNAALSAEDHLAARDAAGNLARLAESDASDRWSEKASEQAEMARRQWGLASLDISRLQPAYARYGMRRWIESPRCSLTPDGRRVVIATSHDRWLFLRTFRLDEQRFETAILVRAPKRFRIDRTQLEGRSLWVLSENAEVLELGLDPPDVLSWRDYGSFVSKNESVEECWIFPKSKSFWMYKESRFGKDKESLAIVDMDKGRVVRRLKMRNFPTALNAGGECRIAYQDLYKGDIQIYSERGKTLELFPFDDGKDMNQAAIHPNGKDFVFLRYPIDGPEDPLDSNEGSGSEIVLETRPEPKGKYPPLTIEDTNGDYRHAAWTSLDNGILFVLFTDISNMRLRLVAVKDTGREFEKLYDMDLPESIDIAIDEFSRQVAVLYFHDSGVRAALLGDNPPEIRFESAALISPEKTLPAIENWNLLCHELSGPLKEKAQDLAERIDQWSEYELSKFTKELKETKADSPDEVYAFVHALTFKFKLERMQSLMAWMDSRFPGYFGVQMERAKTALQQDEWSKAVSILEAIPLDSIDKGSARHVCHMLGVGLFAEGEVQKALDVWTKGMAFGPGRCPLEKLAEYARLSLMPAKKRRREKNALADLLNLFETVDGHLSSRRWSEAIEAMERTGALATKEIQLEARLAYAYLNLKAVGDNGMRRLCKMLALATFCTMRPFEHGYLLFPPSIEIWPRERLENLAAEAKKWLDGLDTQSV